MNKIDLHIIPVIMFLGTYGNRFKFEKFFSENTIIQ